MTITEPSFTIGLEEEYLLVDKETRDLSNERAEAVLAACQKEIGDQVGPEFLTSQIEIGTSVCSNVAELRDELIRLRRAVIRLADNEGLAPIAASTHPFATWQTQHTTQRDRYVALAQDLQGVGRRLVICGMHVHVGIEDDALRIDILNQARYFLPHLLSLSTSSPFWQGENSGLKSYRLSVFDGLPRTGLPQDFGSFGEYRRTIDTLVKAGIIEDASKIWWDLRPSQSFPTLEMRITDVCPLLDDSLTIAATFLCICRMLYRLRRNNQRWRTYPIFLLDENRWRAQRYGMEKGLIDFGRGEVVPFDELLRELYELIQQDAEHFGCTDQVTHGFEISKIGTSADRQLQTYHACREAGEDHQQSLRHVVDQLIEETKTHCD